MDQDADMIFQSKVIRTDNGVVLVKGWSEIFTPIAQRALGEFNYENDILFLNFEEFDPTTSFEEVAKRQLLGVAVLDRSRIKKLEAQNIGELIGKIQIFLQGPLYIVAQNEAQLQVLTDLGFSNPSSVSDGIELCLNYSSSPTLNMIATEIVSWGTNGVAKIKCFFPIELAKSLSPLLHASTEIAGEISIKAYNKEGVGLLASNIDQIVGGDSGTVSVVPGVFNFHTHPDICYRNMACFMGWPSGQDMVAVVYEFFKDHHIITHFVISSEGVWYIHMTPEFQQTLLSLKRTQDEQCGLMMIEKIKSVFDRLEIGRSHQTVDPIIRHRAKKDYLDIVNNYKLSNLFTDFPELSTTCGGSITQDALLYRVDLIKWKTISNGGKLLEFDYIVDPEAGTTAFLPPNFYNAIWNNI